MLKNGFDSREMDIHNIEVTEGFSLSKTKCWLNLDKVQSSLTHDETTSQSAYSVFDLGVSCMGQYKYGPMDSQSSEIDIDTYLCNVDNVAMTLLVSSKIEGNQVVPTYELISTNANLG